MKPVESVDTDNLRINLLTQEIQFAKMLAGNTFDGAIKEKHIDKLGIWLKGRAACTEEFTDKDCMRIWKGLFYSMWMSDKPLPQENLANKIAALLHTFDDIERSLQFFAAFLKTMALEWNGIDQWRIDKFMMLVRKVTREMFHRLHQNDWDDEDISKLNATLGKTILGTDHIPRGLFMHFTELYFEEVAKVSNGEITAESVTKLLEPFMFYVASQSDYKLIQFVVRHVFNHLLFQSESGRTYKEKFDAWKSLNFPGKSIHEMVLEEPEEMEVDEEQDSENDVEVADDRTDEKLGLDPRAGRVDVVMSEIKFDPLGIVNKIEELKYKKFTRVRNRKCLNRIVSTYKKFAEGVFPIGIQRIKIDRDELELPDVEEKAAEFIEFENELYGKQRELKKMNKRKRKKIVSDANLFDEFQAKSNKVAKIKHEANAWTEEDIIEECATKPAISQPKETKPKSNGIETKDIEKSKKSPKLVKHKTKLENSTPVENGTPLKTLKLTKNNSTLENLTPKENGTPLKSPKLTKNKPKLETLTPVENGTPQKTPKLAKNKNNPESLTPAENDKPQKSPKLVKNKLKSENPTPAENDTPQKSPKLVKNKLKPEISTPVTPQITKKLEKSVNSPKSSDKKVNSTSKLAPSKTSTPNIFSDKGTPSEKRVKIALKMNKSQEVTEYIRQLKQSPHLPYDSAKKPSKGVLKKNLTPSPINPFYKRLIGIE